MHNSNNAQVPGHTESFSYQSANHRREYQTCRRWSMKRLEANPVELGTSYWRIGYLRTPALVDTDVTRGLPYPRPLARRLPLSSTRMSSCILPPDRLVRTDGGNPPSPNSHFMTDGNILRDSPYFSTDFYLEYEILFSPSQRKFEREKAVRMRRGR